MSFTWICFLLLDLCSIIPRLPGYKVGYSSMFFEKMKTEKSILSKSKKTKKKQDRQKIKQRCHRYCVCIVCCKLQMAAFQFHDGNSTLAFTAVCSLTLWAGYLLKDRVIQTTILPHPNVSV